MKWESRNLFLITDNARAYLFMRWFRSNGVALEETTPYPPDLNLIDQILI